MLRFALLSVCVALVASQQQYRNQDPRTAAIISEQRYLAGDQFGATYDTEDGTNFKEETDADGTRHGSYSYIDPIGQKRTVSYTAGKNGFQASGDHLPVAPVAPSHAAPQPQQPQYHSQPQQQLHSQQFRQQPQQFSSEADKFDDGQYDPRYNDPSFSPNTNNNFAPAPVQNHAPAPVQNHAPAPVHFNPQPVQQQQPQQQFIPQQQNFNHIPQYTTTQNPHRFQPPGKLALNRTPDGFSYSFNKV